MMHAIKFPDETAAFKARELLHGNCGLAESLRHWYFEGRVLFMQHSLFAWLDLTDITGQLIDLAGEETSP